MGRVPTSNDKSLCYQTLPFVMDLNNDCNNCAVVLVYIYCGIRDWHDESAAINTNADDSLEALFDEVTLLDDDSPMEQTLP